MVPALWFTEVANGLLIAEKHCVTTPEAVASFHPDLAHPGILLDSVLPDATMSIVLSLGRIWKVTAFHATCLEVALRSGSMLATFAPGDSGPQSGRPRFRKRCLAEKSGSGAGSGGCRCNSPSPPAREGNCENLSPLPTGRNRSSNRNFSPIRRGWPRAAGCLPTTAQRRGRQCAPGGGA